MLTVYQGEHASFCCLGGGIVVRNKLFEIKPKELVTTEKSGFDSISVPV